jgi:hypothetical protein
MLIEQVYREFIENHPEMSDAELAKHMPNGIGAKTVAQIRERMQFELETQEAEEKAKDEKQPEKLTGPRPGSAGSLFARQTDDDGNILSTIMTPAAAGASDEATPAANKGRRKDCVHEPYAK